MTALQRPRLTMLTGALALFALPLSPAVAKEKEAPPTPAQVQQVYDCRAIADAAGRLACFDPQVGTLQQAEGARDITIFDRASAQKARRGLFGFTPRDPKAGEKVLIYPGAMGSYFAEIGGQKSIRVSRER